MKLKASNVDTIKLPPGKNDHIEFDDDLTGFGLRLREGGSRTYVVQYKLGTQQRRMTHRRRQEAHLRPGAHRG